ncbi:MAG TPA: tetratricopeptide repeat protein, partial [Gemmataceae bacterium]|nr:tetratricopeptide repeat protein [Gemmataceae bacterium]
LGVTYYRLGDYKDALEALHRAAKLNVAKYQGPHPADLAFLAMAEYRLGHVSESANYLQQLRQRLKEPRWAKNAESWMFLREAEQAAWDLDSRVWNIVQSPQHTEAEYRQALHDLEDACRLMPDNGFIINTLGAAQYRLGQYQEALATLGRSDKINQPAQHGPYPMDVAFRALAEYRLGRVAEAKADLKLLRQRMAQDPWSHKDDFLACFHEVEALLAKAK